MATDVYQQVVHLHLNYVKTHLLKKRKQIRADEFISLHIADIMGRMHVADAKNTNCILVDLQTAPSEDVCLPRYSVVCMIENVKKNSTVDSEIVLHESMSEKSFEMCSYNTRGKKNERKTTILCHLCGAGIPMNPEEHGENEKNLCDNCTKIDGDRILSSRQEEDWRGQTSRDKKLTENKTKFTKRCSRYLSKNQLVIDAVNSVKSKEIPLLNCNVNAGALTCSLFHDIPSLRERTTCERGCSNVEKNLTTIGLEPWMLTDEDFENVFEKHVALKEKKLCRKTGGCKKISKTEFFEIGSLIK